MFNMYDSKQLNYQFIVKEQRSDMHFLNSDINSGDKIEVHWVHSVELTPWIEVYEVTGEMELKLKETRFQSFGAGVPDHDKGTVSIKNGFVVIKDIDEVIDSFKWIHSHEVNFELWINELKLIETEQLPHHFPIEFLIEKR